MQEKLIDGLFFAFFISEINYPLAFSGASFFLRSPCLPETCKDY